MRISCKYCDVELTDDLKEVLTLEQLSEIDGEDFIKRGHFFISDGNYYSGTEGQIVINIKDLKNSKMHFIPGRLNGCCGVDGIHGINRLCVNGHEIATEKSDCWMAHAVIFERTEIKTYMKD